MVKRKDNESSFLLLMTSRACLHIMHNIFVGSLWLLFESPIHDLEFCLNVDGAASTLPSFPLPFPSGVNLCL